MDRLMEEYQEKEESLKQKEDSPKEKEESSKEKEDSSDVESPVQTPNDSVNDKASDKVQKSSDSSIENGAKSTEDGPDVAPKKLVEPKEIFVGLSQFMDLVERKLEMDKKVAERKEKLLKQFDENGDGKITRDEVYSALKQFHEGLGMDIIDEMMENLDFSPIWDVDGCVDYEAFAVIVYAWA